MKLATSNRSIYFYISALFFVVVLIFTVMFYLNPESVNPAKTVERTYYCDESNCYECSRPILIQIDNKYGSQAPVDRNLARKYCRPTEAVIEYHAVIDVLKMPKIETLIDRYSVEEASVKALKYEYIQDQDFKKRILPDYQEINIECIIVVDSPSEKYYYVEDGDQDHKYIEVPEIVFLKNLSQASAQDQSLFWDNLH